MAPDEGRARLTCAVDGVSYYLRLRRCATALLRHCVGGVRWYDGVSSASASLRYCVTAVVTYDGDVAASGIWYSAVTASLRNCGGLATSCRPFVDVGGGVSIDPDGDVRQGWFPSRWRS